MSGTYFAPLKRVFLNLSGGTVTGNTLFTQSVSAATIYSGSTNLYDIFAGIGQGGGTSTLNPTQIGFGNSSSGLTGSSNLLWSEASNFINLNSALIIGKITSSRYGLQSLAGPLIFYNSSEFIGTINSYALTATTVTAETEYVKDLYIYDTFLGASSTHHYQTSGEGYVVNNNGYNIQSPYLFLYGSNYAKLYSPLEVILEAPLVRSNVFSSTTLTASTGYVGPWSLYNITSNAYFTAIGYIGNITANDLQIAATSTNINLQANQSIYLGGDTTGRISVGSYNLPTARLDVQSGSTIVAQLRLRSGATISSPNEGDIWNDGTHFYGRLQNQNRELDNYLSTTQVAFGSSTNGVSGDTSLAFYILPAISRLIVGDSSHNGQIDFASSSSNYLRIEGGANTYITQFSGGDVFIRNWEGTHSLVLQSNAVVRAISLSATSFSANTIKANSITATTLSATTIQSDALRGNTERMVQADTGGTLYAAQEIVSGIVTDPTAITLLTTFSNWNLAGVYTGTTITNTYQGQFYGDTGDTYVYLALADNYFARIPRV